MSDAPRIIAIVEGQGEQAAVPVLLERIGLDLDSPHVVPRHQPILTSRDRFPRDSRERAGRVEQARRAAGPGGAILVLLDSDGEPPCLHGTRGAAPCVLGDDLRQEIERLAPDRLVSVVFAERMYESWLIAAAESYTELALFRTPLVPPDDPETIELDPKDWLTERMAPGRKYKPINDQVRLTAAMQFDLARERSPSFDRAYREFERLIRAVHPA